MKVSKVTGMSDTYTLGNYEKQVLIELDNELTLVQCQRIAASWPKVRSLVENSYDSMLEIALCKIEIKNLLKQGSLGQVTSIA